MGRAGGRAFKRLDHVFLSGHKKKEKPSHISLTNCWAEWKAIPIFQDQRALRVQKPLALVEAAQLNQLHSKCSPHPGPSIGASDDGYIHPPRGPSVSGTANTPHFPLTQLGLSPALALHPVLGREEAPGWLVMGYMHSPILGHLLRFYYAHSTA